MTGHADAPTRTLVIWCPDWPVAAAVAGHDLGDKPVAVVEKGEVRACSAGARGDGVRRGQRMREAQSRCPDLVLLPHDPGEESRRFDPLVAAIESIAPGVQVIRPGTCAVRVRGPARYFGGEEAAVEAIAGALRRLDLLDPRFTMARFGIADGPFCAEQAARATQPDAPVLVVPAGGSAAFLAPRPVAVLGLPELAGLLRRLGIVTLGDFAVLRGPDVLHRFGPVGAHAHRLSGGVDARPVVARTPPPDLVSWTDLDEPADRVDQVAFAVRRDADAFVCALAAAGLVCTTLRVEVVAERGPGSQRQWLHPRWFDAADVVDRVRWQLQGDGTADSALSAPVARVGLIPDDVDPIGAHADALWGGGPDAGVHRALTRVQGMLGHGAVVSAAIGGGRGPADRQTTVPWGDRAVPRWPADAPWVGRIPDPPPSTVFHERLPALVVTPEHAVVDVDARGVLTGVPALFCPTSRSRGRGELLPIEAWAGPWPVSERWWDDTASTTATRFQVVGVDGTAWLLALADGAWWTEARYD